MNRRHVYGLLQIMQRHGVWFQRLHRARFA
jgi:hypothetical protein